MIAEGNRLVFDGVVSGEALYATAALHRLIDKQGYSDAIIDFRAATFLAPEFMLPFVTACRAYQARAIDFEVMGPEDRTIAKVFQNTNWAHLLSPNQFDPTTHKARQNLSAKQYATSDDHNRAVDASMDILLTSLPNIDRSRLKALEWALNEISDNVLNHANSPIGGIMQVMTFPKRQRVTFFVCDAGMTIPRSLRSGRPDLKDDAMALRTSIQEGVTRNKQTNQGNGLYGTFKCCEVSGGEFDILSGSVLLRSRPRRLRELIVSRNSIPFPGTFVSASIAYDYEKLLERALIFKGRAHDPGYDYVERMYEQEGDYITFVVGTEIESFGSREAGRAARTKIENLMDGARMPIEFDFRGVPLISSSFADEVFGKLVQALGTTKFDALCQFRNVDATVRGLIDRAISQRLQQ